MEAFDWTCDEPEAPEPVMDTVSARHVRLVHPLANRDQALLRGSADEVLCDVFNLDRRPGEIYLLAP